MKTFSCVCKNTLFYDNSLCTKCGRQTGWCPVCASIVALLEEGEAWRCGNPQCGALLRKCANYAIENVCNRCLALERAQGDEGNHGLCDCCSLNDTIPDLSVEGNREKWFRLEGAKRRLVYDLQLLDLPLGRPLAFDFKADVPQGLWRGMGTHERVLTGHANGKITINIREADSIEREKLRVYLGEPQRTLIGHLRHEIGHYYWSQLVAGQREEAFREHFGDHDDPPYAAALERHYAEGAPPDWPQRYVSAYASMHPWEDFAETFAVYLEMVGALDTSRNMVGSGPGAVDSELDAMVGYYQRLGLYLNEMNRGMGLLDVVPEVINDGVMRKLRFIHDLAQAARAATG